MLLHVYHIQITGKYSKNGTSSVQYHDANLQEGFLLLLMFIDELLDVCNFILNGCCLVRVAPVFISTILTI